MRYLYCKRRSLLTLFEIAVGCSVPTDEIFALYPRGATDIVLSWDNVNGFWAMSCDRFIVIINCL